MRSPVLPALAVALSLAACGATPPTGTAPVGIPDTPPSARSSIPASVITGFGATNADWNASHISDSDFAPGAVYNPDPTLPEVNGHVGARYVTVSKANGRITSYSVNLHPGTPIGTARADALHEVPADAQVVWVQSRDTCYQEEIKSARLAAALGSPIGDTSGEVLVEFETGTIGEPYNSANIDSATFSLGGEFRTPADAPPC